MTELGYYRIKFMIMKICMSLKNVTHISCHCYSKYLLIDKTELGNRDSVVSLGGGE